MSCEEEEEEFDFKSLILNLIYDDEVLQLKRVLGLNASSRRDNAGKDNGATAIEDLHELNIGLVANEKDTNRVLQVLPAGHPLQSMNWYEEHSKTNLD